MQLGAKFTRNDATSAEVSERIQRIFVADTAIDDDAAVEARRARDTTATTAAVGGSAGEALVTLARPRNVGARHRAAFVALLTDPRAHSMSAANDGIAEEGGARR